MIPLGVDRVAKNRPIATQILVAVNIVVFLGVSIGLHRGSELASWVMDKGAFVPGWTALRSHPWTPVTYAFLHDPSGLAHVAFNMLFLWVFGRAVEGRLGSWWFLAFYTASAAVAAVGQWMASDSPVIGASGAVAGVTGAFAALCPRARVKVLFLLSVFEISGLALVALFVAIDLLGQLGSSIGLGGRVAYSAHLAGYAFGISMMLMLLGLKVLPRTEFDLFFLLKQWQRRRTMREALSVKNSPWRQDAMRAIATPTTPEGHLSQRAAAPQPLSAEAAQRELNEASLEWGRGNYSSAATRWERFAQRCPAHPDADGALLLAAIAYARKLSDRPRARGLAQRLLERVPAPPLPVLEQARALITEISTQQPSAVEEA